MQEGGKMYSSIKAFVLLILCLFFLHAEAAQADRSPLEIETLYLENILPSRYKYYTQEPLGRIRLKNNSSQILKRIRVSLFVPEYMNLAEEYEIESIKPNSVVEIPLKATFNRKIFEVDEDAPAQIEVRVISEGAGDRTVRPITILGRNSIDWRESGNIASFVTPNDSVIAEFTKLCIPSLKDEDLGPKESRLQDAMAIYAALSPIAYLPDPNMPYKKVAKEKVVVDKVQYPRETLKYKKGDCDDLSVLYTSCLEAVGIRSAFVLVPGHIFIIFNTGLLERAKELISYDQTSYIIRDSYVWLPVEVTRLGKPFMEAVREGADEYRRYIGRLEVIDVQKGWDRFAPVALPPTDFPWKEDQAAAEKKLRIETTKFKEIRKQDLDQLVAGLKKKVKEHPQNIGLRNRLGIIYGKEEEWDLAEKEFKAVLAKNKLHSSSLNNLANTYLFRGLLDEAVGFYKEANRNEPEDGGICFNLALAFFLKEDMKAALEMLGESIRNFYNLQEAASVLGFPVEEVSSSLTGRSKVSKEEIKRLLEDAAKKESETEHTKEKAKRTFTLFATAGTRGKEVSTKADELKWLLYWKE